MAKLLTAVFAALLLCGTAQALDIAQFLNDPKYLPFLQKAIGTGTCLSDPAVSSGALDLDKCPSLLGMLVRAIYLCWVAACMQAAACLWGCGVRSTQVRAWQRLAWPLAQCLVAAAMRACCTSPSPPCHCGLRPCCALTPSTNWTLALALKLNSWSA
jgi:hypothetical protein